MKQLYSVLAFCGLYIVSDNEEASFLRGNLEEKHMVEVQRKYILFVRSLKHFEPLRTEIISGLTMWLCMIAGPKIFQRKIKWFWWCKMRRKRSGKYLLPLRWFPPPLPANTANKMISFSIQPLGEQMKHVRLCMYLHLKLQYLTEIWHDKGQPPACQQVRQGYQVIKFEQVRKGKAPGVGLVPKLNRSDDGSQGISLVNRQTRLKRLPWSKLRMRVVNMGGKNDLCVWTAHYFRILHTWRACVWTDPSVTYL